jgi:hypothetical protein
LGPPLLPLLLGIDEYVPVLKKEERVREKEKGETLLG